MPRASYKGTRLLIFQWVYSNADDYTYQRIETVSLLTATAFRDREVKMIGTTILA